MSEPRPNPFGCFDRRYLVETLPSMALLAASAVLIFALPRTPSRRTLVTGLLSAAIAWLGIVTVASIRRLDEFQQRIHLVAIAVAFATTAVVLALAPLAERVGLPWWPSGAALWDFMFVAWGVGVLVQYRRYR